MGTFRPHAREAKYCLHTDDIAPMPPLTQQRDNFVARHHADNQPRLDRGIRAIATSATALVVWGGVWLGTDIARGIQEGKIATAHSHSQVHDIAPANPELNPLYEGHGTFILTGLGTKDPSATAEQLAVHRETGRVFGVEYSNDDLNIREMAEQMITSARAAKLDTISLDGYSAGGLVGLAIAAYLRTHAPDIYVATVTLNSTPVGEGSLTPQSARGIALMNHILSVNEDFKYYLRGRIAVEVLNRSDRYLTKIDTPDSPGFELRGFDTFSYGDSVYQIDYARLRHEIQSVNEKMSHTNVASASLIDSQAHFIVEANYGQYISELDPNTQIIYTGSVHTADDQVVNSSRSIDNLVRAAQTHRRMLRVLHGDIGHANPTERLPEYTEIIRRQIRPLLNTRLLVHKFGYSPTHEDDAQRLRALGLPPPR